MFTKYFPTIKFKLIFVNNYSLSSFFQLGKTGVLPVQQQPLPDSVWATPVSLLNMAKFLE